MKHLFTLLVFTLALSFSFSGSVTAQSVTAQSALDRMSEIMEEMEKLQAEFQLLLLQQQVSGTPAVQGAQATAVLTEDLSYGATNDDIARIQRLLATDPEIYEYGVASGFFGPKTQEAIRNLQTRFNLDPVGVIGPATTALLESYFRAYPDENYPAGVLTTRPANRGAVLGANQTPAAEPDETEEEEEEDEEEDVSRDDESDTELDSVDVHISMNRSLIEVRFANGDRKQYLTQNDDEDDIIDYVADKTDVRSNDVEDIIDFTYSDEFGDRRDNDRDSDEYDEDENGAEDAIADAEDAIDAADEEIDEAEEEDDEEIEYSEHLLDKAEDALRDADDAFEEEEWEDAIEFALEAIDLAEEAEDQIGEDAPRNEIDVIEVEVDEGESFVYVEYADGDEEDFFVEEDRKENIIEEVADELNVDIDDVEEVIEFDFGRVESIEAYYEDGRVRVEVEFRSGVGMRLKLDEDLDEDEVIEAVAEELDIDEEDVDDIIGFTDDR